MRKFTGWLIIIFCAFLSLIFLATIFVLVTGDASIRNSNLFSSNKDMLISSLGFVMMVALIFQGFKKGIELLNTEASGSLTSGNANQRNVSIALNEFTIKEEGFKEIKKETLRKNLPTFIFSSLIGIFFVFYTSTDTQNSIYALVLPIVVLLVILPFSLSRGIEKHIRLLRTYKLILEPEAIVREQKNATTIRIKNTDITEIIRTPTGGFIIKGRSKQDVITVPKQVNNYDEVERILLQTRPITTQVKIHAIQKYGSVLSVVTISLLVAVYGSDNKVVVGVCGILSLLLLTVAFIEILTNEQLDKKTKLTAWYVLIIIISVSVAMYFKLTAVVL